MRALVLVFIAVTIGCTENATILFVTVSARESVAEAVALEVTSSYEVDSYEDVLTLSDVAVIAWPTSFVIKAGGRQGPVEIVVKAVDRDGRPVGHGRRKATLIPGQRTDLFVTLDPSDFQVNDRHEHDQIFSLSATGRQLAAAEDGRLAAVWEDQAATLSRYDIWCRLFDDKGAPRTTASGQATSFSASPDGTLYFDQPAVAMQSGGALDGHFVVTWIRSPKPGGPTEVRSRAFEPDGKPDSSSAAGKEQLLSAGGARDPSVPDIDVLADGDYVVVWQQRSSTGDLWHVMGRLLDSHGRPIASPNGQNVPFELASFFSAESASAPTPVVAGGRDGGFLAAWVEQGNIRATAYGDKSSGFLPRRQRFFVAGQQSGKARDPSVAAPSSGYAVIWTDGIGLPDADGTCIRFRRFESSGQALEAEYTLNTTTAGDQRHPALAVQQDGALLAAWSTSGADIEDPMGGIRGRTLLAHGLPLGADFRINTTTRGTQEKPSIAALSRETFAAVFIDRSLDGPDTQGSGVRGVLLYPDVNPRDGQIGALCDGDTACNMGLRCTLTAGASRCVASCTGPADACPHGGRCMQDPGATGHGCLY